MFDLREAGQQSTDKLAHLPTDADDYDSCTSSDDQLEAVNLLVVSEDTPPMMLMEDEGGISSAAASATERLRTADDVLASRLSEKGKQINFDRVSSHYIDQIDATVQQTTKVHDVKPDINQNSTNGSHLLPVSNGSGNSDFILDEGADRNEAHIGRNEIENLQQIFAEITSIRQRHNGLISEFTDNKRRVNIDIIYHIIDIIYHIDICFQLNIHLFMILLSVLHLYLAPCISGGR